ncbi:hypothetical protein BCV70DRAFT_190302 [Testicularia cyperi]|uniref:Autophagy-related protein 11 n=1 Tax=Testicularia cyperi TaxID=1882483 RepID=A0A317XPT4_9BASI|nr:hypothetical protein BCV70DRAFT_190302 [Testicularia cyperi]
MRVIRAHDGRSIIVNQPLSQFPTLEDLLDSLSLAAEIPSDAIICMTSDGSQLSQQLLQHITQQSAQNTTSESQSITASQAERNTQEFFVFNRDFLYTDPTELAAELAEHPILEPQLNPDDVELHFPPTPRSLETLVAWTAQLAQHASSYEQRCRDLYDRIASIARSTQIALLNLQSHASKIEQGASALIADVADRELARMRGLLDGYERDLYILGMVQIHPRLQSTSSSSSLGANTGGNANSASNSGTGTSAGNGSKPRHRTLGDYISKTKMSAVADACTKVFNDLRGRIDQVREELAVTRKDTSDLAAEVEATNPEISHETYQRVLEAEQHARTLHAFIHDTCSPDAQGWPVADRLDHATFERVVAGFDELVLLDEVAREAVQRLTQDRNDILERSLHLLIDISSLQSEFAETGALLAAVDADLHSNKLDGFKHLSRLKNMLWAYGASVVEVVRRREFAKHFLGKSQSLAELMAKLSASEWKRRQLYRSDVSSLLPWEVKGMDDKPPSLEITTPRVSSEALADLGIEDLEALFQVLDQVDHKLRETSANNQTSSPSPIPEVKAALQRLAAALQDLDEEFVQLVHIQLLGEEEELASDEEDESGSDTSVRERRRLRRRKRIADGTAAAAADSDKTGNGISTEAFEQLQRELTEARDQHARERDELQDQHKQELERMRSETESLQRDLEDERSRAHDAEAQRKEAASRLDALTTDLETEKERRLNMVDEVSQLRRDLETSHRQEAEARQEALEEGDRVNELEQHLQEMQIEIEEARAARTDASNRIEALLSEGSSIETELRTAQTRIEELTKQLSTAHADTAEIRESIAKIEAAKEKQIRSYRAEADGDRAILEEKVRALEADLDAKQRELDEQTSAAKRTEQGRTPDREAIELLRGQLRAADDAHEELVQEMERAKAAAEEAEAARREVEASRQQLLERSRLLLGKTHLLRKAVRAMPVHASRQGSSSSNATTAVVANAGAHAPGTAPAASGASLAAQRAIAASTGGLSMSEMSETERQAALDAFETDAEAADLETTLEALRAFDAGEMYDEIKGKLDSLAVLLRKWQKAWKSANDKVQRANATSRDKIAFRNFQPGDLALFLPTRNSSLAVKPWAAFNVSFPHFFLHATGSLADQLKAKDHHVARITTITEHVAANITSETKADGDKDSQEYNGKPKAAPSSETGAVVKAGNPFQLAEGVRFFLLDVEPFSGSSAAPPSLRSRKSSSTFVSASGADAAVNGNGTGYGKGGERRPSDRRRSTNNISSISRATEEADEHEVEVDATIDRAKTVSGVEVPPTPTTPAAPRAGHVAGSLDDKAGDTSGFSIQSHHLRDVDDHTTATPPMQTPDTSPRPRASGLPIRSGTADSTDTPTKSKGGSAKAAGLGSNEAPASLSINTSGMAVHIPAVATPSGLTRALRAASPASARPASDGTNGGVHGRPRTGTATSLSAWSARSAITAAEEGPADADGSSAGGSSSRRSAILDQATMAPAFGRRGGPRRPGQDARNRNLSPSDRDATGFAQRYGSGGAAHDGLMGTPHRRGVISAPASQSRSEGIAIRASKPLAAELGEAAMTNPFSQSPGPASLPADREGLSGSFGGRLAQNQAQARRKSSLSISTSASAMAAAHESGTSTGANRQGESSIPEEVVSASASDIQPKVERWPTETADKKDDGSNEDAHAGGSRRIASSASTTGMPRAASIRINGRSLIFDSTSGSYQHRRQASSSSAMSGATTAVTTTHAIPGAFPSSLSSNGSSAPLSTAMAAGDLTAATAGSPGSLGHLAFTPPASAATMRSSPRAAGSGGRKSSFLSQTLGRFAGAAVSAVNAPPFAPPTSSSVSPQSPTGSTITGSRTLGRVSPRRPSLFQAYGPSSSSRTQEQSTATRDADVHRGTPDSAVSGGNVSGFSNLSQASDGSTSAAEGLLKRFQGHSQTRTPSSTATR